MILEVGVAVDGDVVVALGLDQSLNYIICLLQVALAVGRRSISPWETGLKLGSVWPVVAPRRGEACSRREIVV